MTSGRDPNLFGDHEPGESLELPLEMFFAEDRGDPQALAAGESLAAEVLDRVESERGFVSGRERKLIRAGRFAVLTGAACVLLAAAVTDRLGLAPWSPAPQAGPLSGLVASTSAGTAGGLEQAREIRDQLLRVVNRPSPEPRPRVQVVYTLDASELAAPRDRASGPYLTAEGLDQPCTRGGSTVIRFEDGFSMPAMAGASTAELRWPASREVTLSVVSVEGGCTGSGSKALSPAWYAKRCSDGSR